MLKVPQANTRQINCCWIEFEATEQRNLNLFVHQVDRIGRITAVRPCLNQIHS